MRVFFCGDIMPGGVLPYQNEYIDSAVLDYMATFDYRIGTLECAIGTNIQPAPEKLKENGGNNNICYARNEDFFRIKEMGFNAVSLGNNHSFDLGEKGLKNTIKILRENGIGYFGAGMNKEEVSKPLLLNNPGGETICIIGCCINGLSPKNLIVATEKNYGVYQPKIEELEEQIKSLKGLYNYVIVMPHWGEEHVRIPPVKNVKYARRMIDAGADAVFGSHSHCLAPCITYKGKPIYFSMGNYLNPDKCLTPPRPFYYPTDKRELGTMPRCLNYPWSIKKPTILVSGEDTRLGLSVDVCIGTRIRTSYRIVRLDKNNVLRWYKDHSKVKNGFVRLFLMPITGLATKSRFYKYLYKVGFKYERNWRNLGDFRKNI